MYILTNPSFKDYVKIEYDDDIQRRLKQLNRKWILASIRNIDSCC